MEKVTVLMSTYNGEKYLEEQLDSILKQVGVKLRIIVRDDGSNDNTIGILKKYASENLNLTYYQGENLKPAKSFLDLIAKSDDADYYAFSDQDDVWDKDKLECSITTLKNLDLSKPALYYSNLRIVDQNLKYYRLSHTRPHTPHNKYSSLVDSLATGCTIVFNKEARNIVKSRVADNCLMHDTWLFLVCSFFGAIIYDSNAHISYRQHENNVIGTCLTKNTFAQYQGKFKRLFNRELQPRFNNTRNFYYTFGDLLNDEDKQKVLKMVSYKNSISDRLKLLFDRDIRSSQLSRDLSYRLLILLGII